MSTFQNEGVVPCLAVMESIADIQDFVRQSTAPFFVLGKGSNTVVNPSSEIHTFVQISPDLIPISHVGNQVVMSAGTRVNQLTKYCIQHGLAGFEFAAGVPASLGGMVVMNFGCWGREIADCLVSIQIVDEAGVCRVVPASDLEMGYRSSRLMRERWIVVSVTLALQLAAVADVQRGIDSAIQTRLAKQPLRAHTFGSTFKNPPHDFAARLIESVGLKGFEKEGVKISDKHANFLINTGGATFQALEAMLVWIESRVWDEHGIRLEREVRLVK